MDEERALTELLGGHSMGGIPHMERLTDFRRLMSCYQCAMLEVKTKLDVLNLELSLHNDLNPIEDVKCRLKSPVSIMEKLKRRNLPLTFEGIEKLNDIAGIRVICSFLDDIYMLRNYLVRQDDVSLVMEKDYIAHPKSNGYRSLHLILRIPIFLSTGKKYMNVEVQFRTIAMDFWASNEHKLTYKQEEADEEDVTRALAKCAEAINRVDVAMQEIKERVRR